MHIKKLLVLLFYCMVTFSGKSMELALEKPVEKQLQEITDERITALFQPIAGNAEQLERVLEILSLRAKLMSCFFSSLAEMQLFQNGLTQRYFFETKRKLDESETKASAELKRCLAEWDRLTSQIDECSYQRIYFVMEAYDCFAELQADTLYMLYYWQDEIIRFWKIVRSHGKENAVLQKLSPMLGGLATIFKKNPRIVVEKKFTGSILSSECLHIVSRMLQETIQPYRKQIENFAIALEKFAIGKSQKTQELLFRTYKNRTITERFCKKIELFLQEKEKLSKIGESTELFILHNYYAAYTTARMQNQLQKVLFRMLAIKHPDAKSPLPLYPLHIITDTAQKEGYAGFLKAIILFSQEIKRLVQIGTYVINLKDIPLVRIIAKMQELHMQCKADKDSYKLAQDSELTESVEKTEKELEKKRKEFAPMYNQLYNIILSGFYNKRYDPLFKQYAQEIIDPPLEIFQFLKEVCIADNSITLTYSTMLPYIARKLSYFLGEKARLIELPSIIFVPHFIYLYRAFSNRELPFTYDSLSKEDRERIHELALSCKIQKKHNKPRNEQKNGAEEPTLEDNAENEVVTDAAEKNEEDPPNAENSPPAAQLAKKITISWSQFGKLCEQMTTEYVQVTSILHKVNDLIMLKLWRGYSSNQHATIVLYPFYPPSHYSERHDIFIDEAILPKRHDKLDNAWDVFHSISTEVDRFLQCAQIAEHGSPLARQLHLKLKADQYALCLRTKIIGGTISPEYALMHKDDNQIGKNGYIVYIVSQGRCTHLCFHKDQ